MNKLNCCELCVVRPGGSGGGQPICYSDNCPCHTTQTTPHEEWESDFEKIFVADWLKPQKERIKDFIRETRTAAYAEGAKDAEGTKNGVQRYQMVYADGVRDALEVVEGTNQWISSGISMSSSEIKKQISEAISTLLK